MELLTTLVFVLILLGLLTWWVQIQQPKTTEFMKRLPEPDSTWPIIGLALDFASHEDVLTVLYRYSNNFGSVIKTKLGLFRRFILVSDYKLLEQILSSPKILTKSDDYLSFHPWLGTGLLTSDGAKWKKHRKLLTPAFHFQILEQFMDVFEKCGDVLIKKLETNLNKISVNICPYITLCSLDIICESIMGININSQENDDSEYVRSVKNMCRIIVERAISPIETCKFLFPFTRNYWSQQKSLKILHKQSTAVIAARKLELEKQSDPDIKNNEDIYFKNKKPFLDLLLQTKVDGEPLTLEEIREEVDTFMFEGHDTTSSAISFILYSLANNPDPQKKAYEEQEIIFNNKVNESITYADLQDMKYLECVIKESLRLYPPVPFYGRQVTEDLQLGEDIIPKGVTIGIFAFAMHRNAQYYENPESFIPERFENSDGKLPYAYIPFSAGPRNCIGQKFAMLEMKSIVSKILRNFELLPAKPEHKLHLISETILKSSNGVHISLRKRC